MFCSPNYLFPPWPPLLIFTTLGGIDSKVPSPLCHSGEFHLVPWLEIKLLCFNSWLLTCVSDGNISLPTPLLYLHYCWTLQVKCVKGWIFSIKSALPLTSHLTKHLVAQTKTRGIIFIPQLPLSCNTSTNYNHIQASTTNPMSKSYLDSNLFSISPLLPLSTPPSSL